MDMRLPLNTVHRSPHGSLARRLRRRDVTIMTPLAAAVLSTLSWITAAPSAMAAAAATGEDSGSAGAYEFNAAFLMGMGGGADLSRYQYGNPVDPGVYLLDIAVNGTVVDRREVIFM